MAIHGAMAAVSGRFPWPRGERPLASPDGSHGRAQPQPRRGSSGLAPAREAADELRPGPGEGAEGERLAPAREIRFGPGEGSQR